MKESPRWLKYLTWLLFALSFLGVLVAAALIGLRYYVRRGMTAAEIAEMEAFFEEPVEIPEEWQEIEPFPENVILAGDRLHALWMEPGDTKPGGTRAQILERLGRGEDLQPGQWEWVEESLRIREGYLEALIELVRLPGYEMDAFPGDENLSRNPGYSRIPQMRVGFEYILLHAHALGKSGNYAEALETCIVALSLFRHHPATSLVNHMITVGGERETCRTILQLATTCEDAEALERALGELSRVARERSACDLEDPYLVDWIGILRDFARQGFAVDLSPGHPHFYYFRQMMDLFVERGGGRRIRWDSPLSGRTLAEQFYRTRSRVPEKAKHDWLTSLPIIDLTRLALASGIVELQTGAKPTSMDDLVPEYFPEPLIDPLSNQPYLWSERWGTFYSIGTNKTAELDSMALNEEGNLEGGDDIVADRDTRPRRPRPRRRPR